MDILLPYNIRSGDVHQQPAGPRGQTNPDISAVPCLPPLAHWGEPFQCPPKLFVGTSTIFGDIVVVVLADQCGNMLHVRRQFYTVTNMDMYL